MFNLIIKIDLGGLNVDAFAIIIVIILSLWSITKTLEKLTNKVLDKQNKQSELLGEIKSKLEGKTDQ
jgi:hypothetical protein